MAWVSETIWRMKGRFKLPIVPRCTVVIELHEEFEVTAIQMSFIEVNEGNLIFPTKMKIATTNITTDAERLRRNVKYICLNLK